MPAQQQQPPQPPQMPQPVSSMQPPQHMPAVDSNASIIEQLQAQNAALIEQNSRLNDQVVRMVQGGAQFQQQQQPQYQQQQQQQPAPQVAPQYQPTPQFPNVYEPFDPPSLAADVDYSLESLASEIGKGNKGSRRAHETGRKDG